MSADNVAAKATTTPRFYSLTAAAQALGVSRSHLYAMNTAGLIKFGNILGKRVVSDIEIARVVATVNEAAA